MRTSTRDAGRRTLLGAARAVLKSISARASQTRAQHVDLTALAGEAIDGAEHMEPYGWTARPHPGAEAVVVFVGGNRSHPLVVSVADRRYRMQGLVDGEVAIHDDLGQAVHLTRDGIRIIAPTTIITGDLVVEQNLTVNGDTDLAGAVRNAGTNISASHVHSGVTAGLANTGTPS